MFPENDKQFTETTIATSKPADRGGWDVSFEDGWCFFVPASSPITPKVGMTARLYGKGLGCAVRGLFIDGQKVYYRTEAEQAEKSAIDLYGADAADWLKRWDANKLVWTIEMGGMGPGYEQAIQITVAEILRHLLDREYDHSSWSDAKAWAKDREEIEAASFGNERISALGLSGAQWGAAMNLAAQLYANGPRAIMADERVKDRKIQARRTFPGAANLFPEESSHVA